MREQPGPASYSEDMPMHRMVPAVLAMFVLCLPVRASAQSAPLALDSTDAPAVPFPDVRRLMSETLARHEQAQVFDLLGRIKRNDSDTAAANGLIAFHEPGYVEYFRPLLDGYGERAQTAALAYLGNMKDSESLPKMVVALSSPSPLVRATAAEALGRLADPSAVKPLEAAALRNLDKPLGPNIVEALSAIPGDKATAALRNIVKARGPERALAAVVALATRGDAEAFQQMAAIDVRPDSGAQRLMHAFLKRVLGFRNVVYDLSSADRRKSLLDEAQERIAKGWTPPVPMQKPEPLSVVSGVWLELKAPPAPFERGVTVTPEAEWHNETKLSFLVVPDEDSHAAKTQWALFRDGREVARHERPWAPQSRYFSHPSGDPTTFTPAGSFVPFVSFDVNPGAYELEAEVRILCADQLGFDFTSLTQGRGPWSTIQRAVTFVSNRVPVTIVDDRDTRLTDESIDALADALTTTPFSPDAVIEVTTVGGESRRAKRQEAFSLLHREGPRGLDAVLKRFDPASAPYVVFGYLSASDDPRAVDAVLEAVLAGNKNAGEAFSLYRSDRDEAVRRLAALALGDHRYYGAREDIALKSLRGHLGPEYSDLVPALITDLLQRLTGRSGMDNAGPAGAYMSAFYLGVIGDPQAVPALNEALAAFRPDLTAAALSGEHQSTFHIQLHWNAAAALKLIDLQNRPLPERIPMAKEWLRHCFSSPEEHFMSRGMLIPYLNRLLGPDRQAFYKELRPTVTDPWMLYDIDRAL